MKSWFPCLVIVLPFWMRNYCWNHPFRFLPTPHPNDHLFTEFLDYEFLDGTPSVESVDTSFFLSDPEGSVPLIPWSS